MNKMTALRELQLFVLAILLPVLALSPVFIGPRIPYGNTNAVGSGLRAGITLMFPN